MVLVTPVFAIAIFVVIVVVAIVAAWWWVDYTSYDKATFHTFISVLTGLGIIITFLFYYNLLQLQQEQQELAAIQETARINDSVLNNLLDAMLQASTIIPNFVLSITPLTNEVCCANGTTGTTGCTIPTPEDLVNPQTCTEKFTLSYRIFSLWQDIIVSNRFLTRSQVPFISNFLQRANSTQLYAQWTAAKLNFNPKTQSLGDLLFEYGLPITEQTPAVYIATAEALIDDPRYQALIT
jgi:hypothetical protein